MEKTNFQAPARENSSFVARFLIERQKGANEPVSPFVNQWQGNIYGMEQ